MKLFLEPVSTVEFIIRATFLIMLNDIKWMFLWTIIGDYMFGRFTQSNSNENANRDPASESREVNETFYLD